MLKIQNWAIFFIHPVFDEYLLKDVLIEGYSESICHSMHSYWGSEKNATVHDLVLQAISLTKLNHGSCSNDGPRHNDQKNSRRGSTGCRGRNANNINSNFSSSINSSHRNALSCQGSTITAMHIWHEQLQCVLQSFLPRLQRRQSKMCHSPVSVGQISIQLCKPRPFYFNSVRHLSTYAKPTFLLLRNANDGTHWIQIADVPSLCMYEHRRHKVWKWPQTCTPNQLQNQPPNMYAAFAYVTPPLAKKLKEKVKMPVTFVPSDHPPGDVESYEKQLIPYPAYSRVALRSFRHIPARRTRQARLRNQIFDARIPLDHMFLAYSSTRFARCGVFLLRADLLHTNLD